MFWKKISRWLASRFNARRSNSFDRALLKQVHRRRLPSWRQFTYLNQFLNIAEKRVLLGLLALVVLTIFTWGGIVLASHIGSGPKAGGDYSEGLIGEPKYLNPLFASNSDVDQDLSSLIYSGLFAYNADRQLTPVLAENYTVSADSKTYDITLKKDIRWSDGVEFSADDIIYTFEAIQNPEVGSSLLPAFRGIKIEKVGANTVRFTLKEPYAPFLASLTAGILPEHVWSDINPASIKLAAANLQPIGTGPFMFQKLAKDDLGNIQSYSLTRNEKYFSAKPYLKTITFKFFNDFPQAVEALRGRTIEGLAFAPKSEKNKLVSRNLIGYTLKLPEYTALFFNQDKQPLLKNDSLRLALASAIDKADLVNKALGGEGQIVDSPIPEGQIGYSQSISRITFDINKANALLDKTWPRIQPEEYFALRQNALLKSYGLLNANPKGAATTTLTDDKIKQQKDIVATVRKEMNSGQSFYRKDTGGNALSLTLTTADAAPYPQTAEQIAVAWQKIGIQVSVRSVGARQIGREIIKTRDYGILLYSEILGGDPDLFPFWHSSQTAFPGLNLSLYSSRTADGLLTEARATADNNQRAALYKKFQAQLNQDLPAIFLFTPYYTLVVSSDVKGINVNRLINPSDRFQDLINWYVKTTWAWKR